MSKVRLTGSNSGYVEIAAAADAGNLTFTMPTSGTALLGNNNNVFSGITTTGQLDINGSIDVSSTSVFNDDVTLTGGSYNVVWDKSDNQLEFADNAKLSFGASSDMQLYHDGNHSYIDDAGTGNLRFRSGTLEIQNLAGNKTSAIFSSGGGQTLNFNNSTKFVTTNTGVNITGICTATSFSGSGEGLTRTSQFSHRNMIINGDMRVAQRATSKTGLPNSGNTIDVCDRWGYSRNGPTATLARVEEVPSGQGFKYSLKLTNTSPVGSIAAGNMYSFTYKIERQDVQRLGYGSSNAKSATISFWVKGSLSGKIGIKCDRNSKIFSTNVDIVANTWKFVEVLIPADTSTALSGTDTDNGFSIAIVAGAGGNFTSGTTGGGWINFHTAYAAGFTAGQQGAYLTTNGSTFQITAVQLEVGSQSTPFEHIPFIDELARCQRYAYRLGGLSKQYQCVATGFIGHNGSTDTGKVIVHLPTTMRTNPSISVIGTNAFWVHTGGAETGTSDMDAQFGAPWNSASSGNQVWLDFARTGGGSPNRGVACVVYTKSNNQGELLFDADL